ncbi:MAG: hypothetical protein D6760_02955, partial [Deltaproteobacteria bacterium]
MTTWAAPNRVARSYSPRIFLPLFTFLVLLAALHVGIAGAQTRCFDPPGKTHRWLGDGDATDSVGSSDGTLVGDATFGPGLVGQAFLFDGSGDYVEISGSSVGTFGSSDFSVLFWFKADSLGSARYLMGKSLPDFGQGWDIRLDGQAIDTWGLNNWTSQLRTGDFASAGTWYH